MHINKNLRIYPALALAVICWGLSFVGTKIALESFTVYALILMRFSTAAIIFGGILVLRGFPHFCGKDHVKIAATAIVQPGLYFLFETAGLAHTTASKAALIVAAIPMVVLLLSYVFLGERSNPLSIVGICLSFLGIGLLVTGDPGFVWQLGGTLFGDVLMFGAVAAAALYMLLARNLGQKYSALQITSVQMIYGTLFLLPLCLWHLDGLNPAAASLRSLTALVFLVVFATVVAFFCYNYALTKISAASAAVFINGVPVVTATGAWILLGETLAPLQITGGATVVASVLVTNYFNNRR